ncbi:nucleolar protein 12 [Osmerus eperlanus]|uniref:nucleolar protein 12 n=1 Tax=Osmerus eperlanus TaxID=29151 RepID=UPI002E0F4975
MKGKFKTQKNGKGKPGSKKRGPKCIITFDDNERQEYLTGFHKRKLERRKAAVVEIKNKIKEEQKKVREKRHTEYMKLLKERKEALDEDEDELEDAITGTTESVQYDHPNHTVTVTTISDLDLTGGGLLGLPANQLDQGSEEEKEEKGEEGEELEKKTAMPKKSGDPILNKKICSLTASLHSHTKQKKRKGRKSKQQEGKGRGQPTDRKSGVKDRKSGATEKKARSGRTSKKLRRRQTGKRVHHHD